MKLINSARFTAVLDANVLYPVVLRDYLLWLAVYELYTPKWSNRLLDEFAEIFNRVNLNISPSQVKKQIDLMNTVCPNALVEKYESLMDTIELPDENDRHVVAAAIKCNANVIVTNNLKDFPKEFLIGFDLTAIGPDNFIADIIDLDPKLCREAFREMVLSKTKPPYDELDYLEIFRRNGLEQSASELSRFLG